MHHRCILVGVLLVMLATVLVLAEPTASAPQPCADGKAYLAKSDFEGALKAYRTAAQSNPGNVEYGQQYAVLRQIISMRERIKSEKNHHQWMSMAAALRRFYYDNAIYSEALLLDRENFKRHPGADSTAMLAETQLTLNRNVEAEETLRCFGRKETTTRTNVLLGIALARQGKIHDAKALADTAKAKDDLGPQCLYEIARLRALVGISKGALDALARSFELTPPSQLDAAKADARTCRDLKALIRGPEFSKVLFTRSKIKESGCSSGTSCGKCPLRSGAPGQCPRSAKATKESCNSQHPKP